MKYRQIVDILNDHGFSCVRERGSHKQFQGMIDGQTRLVTVDYSQLGEDVSPRNLASMIRQSGLPKRTFR